MLVAKIPDVLTDVGALCVVIVALAAAIAAVGKVVLWATRKVAAEQNDRIGERVAAEMAPVVVQVQLYSEDVKQALSEFRAGERRTGREFLSVWKTLATAGLKRIEEE